MRMTELHSDEKPKVGNHNLEKDLFADMEWKGIGIWDTKKTYLQIYSRKVLKSGI